MPPDLSQLPILVLHGHVYHRRLVATALRAMGATQVTEAEHERDVDAAAAARVGLVIHVDGGAGPDADAFAARLRDGETALPRRVHLLVVSDDLDSGTVERARRAGADGLVGKPVSAKLLYAAVQSIFNDAA